MNEGYQGKIKMLGLPDEFIPHGTPAEQRHYCGIDADGIYQSAKELLH